MIASLTKIQASKLHKLISLLPFSQLNSMLRVCQKSSQRHVFALSKCECENFIEYACSCVENTIILSKNDHRELPMYSWTFT